MRATAGTLRPMLRLSVAQTSPTEARFGLLPPRERAPRSAELTHEPAVWRDRVGVARAATSLLSTAGSERNEFFVRGAPLTPTVESAGVAAQRFGR